MKNIFRKLACYSFLSIASIGCFEVEARVTKEVAEAVLPYLMEAVGIDGDEGVEDVVPAKDKKYKKDKIQAILDMIYTDKGQQQMVEWSNYCKLKIEKKPQEKIDNLNQKSTGLDNGVPEILTKGFPDLWLHEYILDKLNNGKLGEIAKLIVNKNGIEQQKIIINDDTKEAIQALFPCNTGTFTSFANHSSRMGFHILKPQKTMLENLKELLQKRVTAHTALKKDKNIENSTEKNATLCEQLAKVIFILDICDNITPLKTLFPKLDLLDSKESSFEEYKCRPVSATIGRALGKEDGDCVETLYRHLINIAIQDSTDPSQLRIENLPKTLQTYYDKYTPQNGVVTIPRSKSESGLTDINRHKEWQQCLRATLTEITEGQNDIDKKEKAAIDKNTTVSLERKLDTICDILCKNGISPFRYAGQKNVISFKDKQVKFKLFDTATGTVNNIASVLCNVVAKCDGSKMENSSGDASKNIQNALNTISAQNDRFTVEIEGTVENLPTWVTKKIKIEDSGLHRTIVVGVCEKEGEPYYGHAEILSITYYANNVN